MTGPTKTDERVAALLAALRWITDHETDEKAIGAHADACLNPFHFTHQTFDEPDDLRCPECFSRWWATDGSLPSTGGSYVLGAVAAKALAEWEAA
jgi:hypothetical protein